VNLTGDVVVVGTRRTHPVGRNVETYVDNVRSWPISEVHERQLLCGERRIARVVLEQRRATPSDIVWRIECKPEHRWVLAG
jgi:hypothetical protein